MLAQVLFLSSITKYTEEKMHIGQKNIGFNAGVGYIIAVYVYKILMN